MNIENNSANKKVRFDSLEYGDVFEAVANIYMKTYMDLASGINSVNLITNDLESLNDFDMVTKLKAKLVIE